MADEPPAVVALVVSVPTDDEQSLIMHLFEAGAGGVEERDVPGATELWVYGTPDEVAKMRQSLDASFGTAARSFRVRVEAVAPDWERRWSEGLQPVKLSEDLWVAPEGIRAPSAEVLVLGRKLAFGFGEHATTRLAARALIAIGRERPGLGVLDFGTGGGLLALIAERTGAGRVLGLDNDPRAVTAARENARLNGARVCRFDALDLDRIDERFDLVVANVDLPTLVQLARPLAERVAPRGTLLLTGVLVEDEPELERAYARAGLVLRGRDAEDDWALLEFARAEPSAAS